MPERLPIPEAIDGVAYYSQKDPRWSGELYSIAGDETQTMGMSGCVPAKQAAIRTYFEGFPVLPTEMAKWNIAEGFRTKNEGTRTLESMPAFGREFGYDVEQIEPRVCELRRAVVLGGLVLAIVAHPDRDSTLATPGGHAILIRSVRLDSEPILRAHSSSSVEKSYQDWPALPVLDMVQPAPGGYKLFSIRPQ